MTPLMRHVRGGDVEIIQILDTTLDLSAREVFPLLDSRDDKQLGARGPDGLMAMPVYVYVVRTEGHTTLIDTGVGTPREAGRHAGQLPAGLAAAGIAPEEVDTVVLTHLHPDHIGGITDSEGALCFPRARHLASKTEWDFWQAPGWRDSPWEWLGAAFERRLDPLGETTAIELLDGRVEIAPRLCSRDIPGHTPGQIGVEVETGGEPWLFIGDALHHPIQWERPEVSWRDDADAQRASAERVRLVDDVVRTSAVVASAHFPDPGIGRVTRVDGSVQWHPHQLG